MDRMRRMRGGKGRRVAFRLEEDGGDEKGLEEIGYWHFKTAGPAG
jgi:hypothetical protein